MIVCGFGRIGVMLAKDLTAGGAAFVSGTRRARLAQARDLGCLAWQADATDEAASARGSTGRGCWPRCCRTTPPTCSSPSAPAASIRRLQIIARGEAPSTETKLIQAGADGSCCPPISAPSASPS